ncbi:MAG: toll/interleukin-1 receptor domain-containing protein [Paludibacteraceae bacterium]|nr:toll/interleukin-1 receptor domain-containing protein [Paludibacteraceae bacterium]
MIKKYQISLSEVNEFLRINSWEIKDNVNSRYKENKKAIMKHLVSIFDSYKEGEVIDGQRISQTFFPTKFKEQFKVFISHSGSDKDIVEKLAMTLEAYGIDCFVDWMVWGNLNKLQQIIDDKLCHPIKKPNGGKSYDYESRNHTTAHTHAMLSMALLDMIDQCDICLFITSKNSTIPNANFGDVKTLSPWIYEEVSYMNHIAIRRVNMFAEGGISGITISHPLDLREFKELNSKNLIESIKQLNG